MRSQKLFPDRLPGGGTTISHQVEFQDPVCGMTVEPESAAGSFEHKGETYYFCSAHCLHKFRKDPESFIRDSRAETEITGIPNVKTQVQPTYTCPMHPEFRRQGAGSCPKCGMALEPLTTSLPKEKIEYT